MYIVVWYISDLKGSPSGESGIPAFEDWAEWLWLEAVWVGGKFVRVYLANSTASRRAVVEHYYILRRDLVLRALTALSFHPPTIVRALTSIELAFASSLGHGDFSPYVLPTSIETPKPTP